MEGKGSALSKVASFFRWIGNDLKEIGATFKNGDWKTRVSFVIMGFGQLLRKQYVRGIALLASEAAMLWFIFGFGMQYLKDLGTLGTSGRGFNPDGTVTYGDNSFFILLYGILTIIAIALFLLIWRINVKDNKTRVKSSRMGRSSRATARICILFWMNISTRPCSRCRFSASSSSRYCRSCS